MKTTLAMLLLALGGTTTVFAATTEVKKIGGGGPIDRPTNHTGAWCFSAWTFCDAPPDSFVADGDSATVTFRVRNWKSTNPAEPIEFHLDQVAVLERSVYEANLFDAELVPGDPYVCAMPASGVQALDVVSLLPAQVHYYTRFDGEIGPEWSYDPAQVGYDDTPAEQMFDDPLHPVFDGPDWSSTTGSMDLGNGTGPEFVDATLQLTGLTPGTEYVVCYWSKSFFAGVQILCSPQDDPDNYEVSVFGEETVCVPDLPDLAVNAIRTTSWDPGTRLWSFQANFGNDGNGPAQGVLVTLSGLPATVGVVDAGAPVADLLPPPRNASAWSGDSFTLDLSAHFEGFFVGNFEARFSDDCGGRAAQNLVVVFGSPQSYPTSAPVTRGASELSPPFPNPFNPSTVLRVHMAAPGLAELRIVDARGRVVRRLHAGRLGEGEHRFTWDGQDDEGASVASGVYQARLVVGGSAQQRRLVLLK